MCKFSEFKNLFKCELKAIQKDCNKKSNCQKENTRFVHAIKRLRIMLENNEMSNNEAMFRYYNLTDYGEYRIQYKNYGFFKFLILSTKLLVSRHYFLLFFKRWFFLCTIII